jgi:transposase
MLITTKDASIYFCSIPVDLRKGCEGLAYISISIVSNPSDNTYFIFLNRKRNRIKILYWSSNSFFYWYARSRKGVFAPKKTHTSIISSEELQMILNGNFPSRLKAIYK